MDNQQNCLRLMSSILAYQGRSSDAMVSLTETTADWIEYYKAAHERNFVEGLEVAEACSKTISECLESIVQGIAVLVEMAKRPLPPLDLLPPSEN